MRRLLLILALLLSVCSLARAERADNYLPDDTTVVVESSNLPIVWIDVDGAMIQRYERIPARMKIIYNGKGRLNYADTVAHPGQTIDYEGDIALRYRGNTSYYNSDKKPLLIRTLAEPLTPEVYDKKKVEILGMGKDNKWALLAPYSDRSMIRDMLIFELARPWMEYTPDGRYCEVYLDGIYYGIYILCEMVSKGKHRLNLDDPGEDGDELTGGYIVELGPPVVPNHMSLQHPVSNTGQVFTDSYYYFQYDTPDYNDMTRAQWNYINNAIDEMEASFTLENYKDPEVGYRKYIDVQSFMDYHLFSELAHNVDSYRLSAKFYKRRDSQDPRFKMALWDFNLGFGNCYYNRGYRTDTWVYQQNAYLRSVGDTNMMPFYWYKMWRDDSYVAERKARWWQLRANNLRSDRINATIDSLTNVVTSGGALDRDTQARPRWGQRLWPNYHTATSYEDEIAFLKGWLTERLAWLDARFEYVEPPLPPPTPEPIWGDVNGDGEVNIADINVLIDIILTGTDSSEGRSDVNGDGEVSIADVNTLISFILLGSSEVTD